MQWSRTLVAKKEESNLKVLLQCFENRKQTGKEAITSQIELFGQIRLGSRNEVQNCLASKNLLQIQEI